jgi:hypothetical protein
VPGLEIGNLTEYVGEGTGETENEAVNDVIQKFVIATAVVMYFYEQAISYLPLFKDIIYADLFDDGKPYQVRQLPDGMWQCTAKSSIKLPLVEDYSFEWLMDKNYFPLVTSASDLSFINAPMSTKSLATLLAMKCVKLFLPEVGAMEPYELIKARHKLSDNLAQFWAGMLRFSKQLREAIKTEADSATILEESQEFVDREILPAVIELKKQMELERKSLFLQLSGPIQSLIKLLAGTASMNPQALAIAALDASRSVSDIALKRVESMGHDEKKRIFSFLLRLPKASRPNSKAGGMSGKGFTWMAVER